VYMWAGERLLLFMTVAKYERDVPIEGCVVPFVSQCIGCRHSKFNGKWSPKHQKWHRTRPL